METTICSKSNSRTLQDIPGYLIQNSSIFSKLQDIPRMSKKIKKSRKLREKKELCN